MPPAGPALGPQYLKPLPETLGPSSRRGGVVVSEVMHNPAPRADGRNGQFIEVFNSQVFFEDLSGWRLSGDVDFTFPTNTVLGARSFLIVAVSAADFAALYPTVTAPVFELPAGHPGLPRGNGSLRIRHRLGAVMFELDYRDEPRWPAATHGGGHSLVLARPSYGERDPYAWGASERVGGSPGAFEPEREISPLDTVVFNELLARAEAPQPEFVELYNYSDAAVDLGGCILTDDPGTNRFVIPTGTSIPPRGWTAWDSATLGFGLRAAGERLFLFAPERARVLDAIRFEAQARGVSWGRSPDGSATWGRLAQTTAGQANAPVRQPSVVLNELMYHPSSELAEDQFVELHNPGPQPVSLAGWALAGGVRFTFPPAARISAGGYVVVTRDRARFATNYPAVPAALQFGNFSGTLSGAGERITLTAPEFTTQSNPNGTVTTNRLDVVVDEVTYGTGGRWGRWADGGGSSLERLDPRADGRAAANWGDSDESAKSPWVTIEATGPLNLGQTAANAVQLLLQGAGECLVDDIAYIGAGGTNRVTNNAFATDARGWTFQGNHDTTVWDATNGAAGPGCLRLRAVGAGTTGPNRAFTLITAPTSGTTGTLRARVRWLRGTPNLLLRLKGNYLEVPGYTLAAANLGTPGAVNSIALTNAPPVIAEVSHFPVLPRNGQPVRIAARVTDLDGVESVALRYHADTSSTFTSLVMTNAGAGWFTAELPGLTGFQQFHVVATDVTGHTARFPADAPERECNVRYNEPLVAGALGQYRLWVSRTNITRWTRRARLANVPNDTTFVYGGQRVIYNAGAQYSGSPFHAPSYDSPTGNNCDYVVVLPPDDSLLGEEELNLLQPGNGGGDNTAQGEQQAYWIGSQLGLPHCHRRHVLIWVNGVRRGVVYDDAQQPNRDFVRQWFPDDADGDLRKIQLWFEFEADGSQFAATGADLSNHLSQGRKKLARYRWNWPSRGFGNDPHNYTNLFTLVDAVNTKETGARYERVLEQATDVDEWFRTHVTEHLVGNNDSYSYGGGQNMYAYKPEGGPWRLLIWDIDFAFNGANATSDMTGIGGANVGPTITSPGFARLYYQAMLDAVRGPLETNRFNAILDARYNGLRTQGASGVASPASIKSFLRTRRDFLIRLVTNGNSALRFTGILTEPLTSETNVVTLTGSAPLEARTVTLNGTPLPVTWTSRYNWTARVVLPPGTNEYVLSGRDTAGLPITNPPVPISIVVRAPVESPVNRVVISEVLANPLAPAGPTWLELVNLSPGSGFDLSGWRLEGIDYTAPVGTILPPGGRLVIPSDLYRFRQYYGVQLPTAGAFAGGLKSGGETLRLIRPGATRAEDLIVDELRFQTSAPWPETPPGTSLQLVDPTQDNRRPINWQTAAPTDPGNPWVRVVGTGPATSSLLYLYLENLGDGYIDDLQLVVGAIPEVGTNLIPNGDFEGPFPGTGAGAWLAATNHADSATTTAFARSGTHSLHLVATAPGVTRDTALSLNLTPALSPEAEYTLSFWYRPQAAGGTATARLSGSGVRASSDLAEVGTIATGATATPGAVNSTSRPLPPLAPVALNELMPVNTGTVRDAAGRLRPWVELYNAGPAAVSLTNCYLSPTPFRLDTWRLPARTIPAKGFLLVWLDGDTGGSTPTELHANFTLGTEGFLALSQRLDDRLGALDFIHFPAAEPDQSLGDFPDGDLLSRTLFRTATPGQPNSLAAPALNLSINEWMADNVNTVADPADGKFDDWFELYNGGSTSVALNGFQLGDAESGTNRFRIPPGYRLRPGGYLLVWADGQPEQNATNRADLHVDFKLARSGETIVLTDPDGVVLDRVTFGPQSPDVSQGRQPDGGVAIRVLPAATPRGANRAQPRTPAFGAVNRGTDQLILEVVGAPNARLTLQHRPGLNPSVDALSPWKPVGDVTLDAFGKGQFVLPVDFNNDHDDAAAGFFRLIGGP